MNYRVQWDYASSYGGPWKRGETVDLDEITAARINVDSPGVLVLQPATPEPEARAVEAAPHDRMVKRPTAKRSGIDA